MAVCGDDELYGQALELLGDLVRRQARVDHDRLFGFGAGHDVAVDLAIELDLDDPQLHTKESTTISSVQRTAVIVFGGALLLVCLFWMYGYIRRRSRKG